MACTLTLQSSMNFVAPILKNQPLMVGNMEPALMAANMVLGTILGPPFKWRWNRATFQFDLNIGVTDYELFLVPADFGFMEMQWIQDASVKNYQLTGATALAMETNQSRPTRIATEFDDNTGNITFRVADSPDAAYTVSLDYQKKAPLMTSPASTWAPVPDEFAYIFNEGFLARMSLLVNDARFPIFENYFIAHLLSAQDGLSDVERNIFLGNWTALSGTLSRAQGAVNSGAAGRGK
jgi:hypothetical protein